MRLEDISDDIPLPIATTEKGLKKMIEFSLDHYQTLGEIDPDSEQRPDVFSIEEIEKAIDNAEKHYGTDTFVYKQRLKKIREQRS